VKFLKRLALLLALAALAWWLYGVLFPAPEKLIRQRLGKIAELASFTGKEGNLARVAAVTQLVDCFAPTVQVRVDSPAHAEHTFSGKEEIREVLLGVRANLRALEVKFRDPQVTLNSDRTAALAHLTAEARIGTDRELFVQEMKFGLERVDGKWLVAQIETVRTLR
jgi:hypothetical protein